jgi:anaerobic selenocysteine-containing dehydrogenase
MLGGNFVRAIPDRERMEAAWRRMRLTVNVATKLNRSHLVHGEISFLLPVKGRIEADRQATGAQATSMEDSTACVHGSRGVRAPASKHLISEVDFIARLAEAVLEPNPKVPWKAWNDDYSLIRRSIGETYPEIFYDYDRRMWEPGGFHRPLPARDRVWKTKTGKANIITPKGLDEDLDMPDVGHGTLRLITLRSNDQFNTTVYSYNDRFRGIHGTRMVVLMNRDDMHRLGLAEGELITMQTASNDGIERVMSGFRVTPYDIPVGCVGAYYPEANALLPLSHYAEGSKTPAAKSIPVFVRRLAEPGSPRRAARSEAAHAETAG